MRYHQRSAVRHPAAMQSSPSLPKMTTPASITCAGCKHSYQDNALYCPHCGRPKMRDVVEDPLLGRVLGERFLVQEQLGTGASGVIYKAEHVTLRRRVAIKVLHTELSRDDLAVERFRREATTVAEIDNEHIVEIHDFGRTHDGRLYMAMELLEGETLDGILAREKTLSVERTADILIQVGEALMEAHAIGYVHRDLRPRNIYLAVRRGKANFVKLLDFGLAKLVETDAQAASTSLGMTFGDPRYMSPEQARGDRIDLRADIYQLGCVAYEMLTGAPPFAGTRVFDILTKQVSEAPAPLPTRRPGVPLWMESGVARMLAKDPANRFATMTRMVEALRRGLETGEVMEDEIARRRESIPPPSVSRVMAKLGMQDGSGPVVTAPVASAPVASSPPAGAVPAPVPVKPFDGKSTQLGTAAAPAPVAKVESAPAPNPMVQTQLGRPAIDPVPLSPAMTAQLPAMEPRKRTGTPKIGVPIMPAAPRELDRDASDDDTQAPVAGTIEDAVPRPRRSTAETSARTSRPMAQTTARTRRPTDDPASSHGTTRKRPPTKDPLTESQVWFDSGDGSHDEEPDSSRVQRAHKTISPSVTDLEYAEPPKRRLGLYAAIGAVLLTGTALAFTLGGGSSANKPVAPPAPAPIAAIVPADAAPSTVIEPAAIIPDAAAPVAVVPVTPVPVPVTPVGPVAVAATGGPAHRPTGTAPAVPPPPTGRVPTIDDDPAGRRPLGLGGPVTAPPPTKGSGASRGISGADGPVDPYAPVDAPADAPGDRKAEFYANLGSQQLGSGDTVAAAASFKRATELDPKNITAITGLGEIALRQGLFGDAIAHLKQAARLAPKSSRVFTLLGEAYMNSGNSAQAVANFKKALQLDPDNARARDGFSEASARVPPPTDEN